MRKIVLVVVVGAGVIFIRPTNSQTSGGQTLKKLTEFDLPGPAGKRFDYLTIDNDDHYLLSAHLAAGQTYVIDLRTNKVVATVSDTPGVEGIEYEPELKKFYTSNAGDNTIGVVDLRQMKVIKKLRTEKKPDGSAYAAPFHKLYVSDEHGGTDTVIDARTNTRVATIPLGGDVGNTQYDPVTKHIFVNVQTRRQLLEIDPTSDKVIARIDLPGAAGNHGLLIEAQQRKAFIACEDNHKLLVLDLATRRISGAFDVGDDPDVLAYDPGLGYLYVAAESGIVSIFNTKSGPVARLADLNVGSNAHVVAVDSVTHKSYFPLKNVGGRAVLRIMSPSL